MSLSGCAIWSLEDFSVHLKVTVEHMATQVLCSVQYMLDKWVFF